MPCWDSDLVDFMYRVPLTVKNLDGFSKALVRPLLARELQGLGLERQQKFYATSFYQTIDAAEGLTPWSTLGGASALSSLGIVDERELMLAVESFSSAPVGRNRFPQWHVLNHESWTRARL
jgi:hypothetical protein